MQRACTHCTAGDIRQDLRINRLVCRVTTLLREIVGFRHRSPFLKDGYEWAIWSTIYGQASDATYECSTGFRFIKTYIR